MAAADEARPVASTEAGGGAPEGGVQEGRAPDPQLASTSTNPTTTPATSTSPTPEQPPLSAVAMFDQLTQQRCVLTTGETEEKFLEFVRGTSATSNLWRVERAEEEQLRLVEELARSTEQAAGLEAALEKTRVMLEGEAETRRKVEREGRLLERQLEEVRRLVAGEEGLVGEVWRVLGIPITTMDEMEEVEGSKSRRSWSPPNILDQRLDEQEGLRRSRRRSKSVGFKEAPIVMNRSTRSTPSHLLEAHTVLASARCTGCSSRIKFGKVGP